MTNLKLMKASVHFWIDDNDRLPWSVILKDRQCFWNCISNTFQIRTTVDYQKLHELPKDLSSAITWSTRSIRLHCIDNNCAIIWINLDPVHCVMSSTPRRGVRKLVSNKMIWSKHKVNAWWKTLVVAAAPRSLKVWASCLSSMMVVMVLTFFSPISRVQSALFPSSPLHWAFPSTDQGCLIPTFQRFSTCGKK